MSELKSCPCCGAKANYSWVGQEHKIGGMDVYFVIMCEKCRLSTRKYRFVVDFHHGDIRTIIDEREKAADVWNRRVDDGKEISSSSDHRDDL